MPLHDCSHSFQDLAATVLPAYMAKMRTALARPRDMTMFARPGIGTGTLVRELGVDRDFSGC